MNFYKFDAWLHNEVINIVLVLFLVFVAGSGKALILLLPAGLQNFNF